MTYNARLTPWGIKFAYCIVSGSRILMWSLTSQNITPEGLQKLHQDSEET